jgi:hypothetical protein
MYANGAGTFTAPAGIPAAAGTIPGPVVTGDFNDDGRTDIAYATSAPGVAVIYRIGPGWTNPPTTYATPGTPTRLVLGDLNGDNRPDLVCLDGSRLFVLYCLAAGGFGPAVTITNTTATGVGILDYNGDVRADLVITSSGGGSADGRVWTYRGTSAGFVSDLFYFGTPGQNVNPTVGDFNNDGRPDFIFGGGARVFTANGAGGFAASDLGLSLNGRVDIGDFNMDNNNDLLIAGYALFPGHGDGTFGPRLDVAESGPGVAIADFTLDGKPDFAILSPFNHAMMCSINTTPSPITITQQPTRVFTSPGNPVTFSVGASGSPLSFVWRKDGVPLTPASGYTGFDSPTLMIPSAAFADSGSVFDCKVSNSCHAEFSRPVALVVSDPCGSSDFNGDGDFGTDADIEAFFRVLAGGAC